MICLLTCTGYSQWTQIGADIDAEAANDVSGFSVSFSADGNRVAIGAPFNGGTGIDAGHVRIYDLIAGIWTQVGADIDGEAASDQSGYFVSLSADGSRVAIGAPFNGGTGIDAGHVRIYDLIAGTWTQVGADIDAEAAGDESGWSVSLSADGSRIAIGAPNNKGTPPQAGHVRIYELIAGIWTQVGADIDGEAGSDQSGWSVSLSADGSRVAIGAPFNGGTGIFAGHVRIYELIAGVWTQVGADIDAEAASNLSGNSVSLSADGSRIAIGAPTNSATGIFAGHVRIYDLIAGTWTQIGADIDGEAVDNQSGHSVSLTADGNRVAIGAPLNDGTGIDAGHVRIYDLIAGTWTQVGADIDGEAAGDVSGWSVSLSADGSRVAIGALSNGGTGIGAGHVRIYSACPDLIAAAPAAQVTSESTCAVFGDTPMGGVIAAPGTNCPTGSTLMYSIDGTTFSTTLPVYDQVNAITVTTRCDCDAGTDMSPTSAVTMVPGSCPLCPDLTTQAPVVQVTSESICAVFGGTPMGGVIVAPGTNCPTGGTLMYSTDGTTFSTTLPVYDQVNAITVTTRCDCDAGTDMSPTNAMTTVPGSCPLCPDLTAQAPVVQVTSESICAIFGGTPMGGVIVAPGTNCPTGSTLMYSTDGTTFSTTLPVYDQVNAITVATRCDCDAGTDMSPTNAVTTVPGSCPLCPDLTAVTPSLPTVTESTCNMIMGMPMGGRLAAPVDSGCPIGSTLQYSVDGNNFSPTLPTYDQLNAIPVTTKCVCDNDDNIISGTSVLTTMPGECPEELTFNSVNRLMFDDPCNCTDTSNCEVVAVTYFHDTLLVTAGGATGLIITAAVVPLAMDFYTDVPCFGGGPTLITPGTLIPETPPLSGLYKIEFWRPSGTTPMLSVLEGGLTTMVPPDDFQPVCTQEACIVLIPTLGQWGLILLSLLLMILGVIGLRESQVMIPER